MSISGCWICGRLCFVQSFKDPGEWRFCHFQRWIPTSPCWRRETSSKQGKGEKAWRCTRILITLTQKRRSSLTLIFFSWKLLMWLCLDTKEAWRYSLWQSSHFPALILHHERRIKNFCHTPLFEWIYVISLGNLNNILAILVTQLDNIFSIIKYCNSILWDFHASILVLSTVHSPNSN